MGEVSGYWEDVVDGTVLHASSPVVEGGEKVGMNIWTMRQEALPDVRSV